MSLILSLKQKKVKVKKNKMPNLEKNNFWEVLSPELSSSRREKILGVASSRTEHITLVLQDVSSEHNICACLRSAEAFGIQSVHIINESKNYRMSTVAKGSSSWLTIHNHKSIESAAKSLQEEGYALCAAVPPHKATVVPLEELAVEKPLALVFGNEHSGLSKEWDPFLSLFFTIPMFGFVESLNISVSAAISMQSTTSRAKKILSEEKFYLTEEKKTALLNHWAFKKIPHAEKKFEVLTARHPER